MPHTRQGRRIQAASHGGGPMAALISAWSLGRDHYSASSSLCDHAGVTSLKINYPRRAIANFKFVYVFNVAVAKCGGVSTTS